MRGLALLLVAPLMALGACKQGAAVAPPVAAPAPVPMPSPTPTLPVAPVLLTPDAKDVHSHAQPAIARVTHVSLDLSVDFAAHMVSGTARLDLLTAPDAASVVLDTNALTIRGVTDGQGRVLQYTLGTADPILGAPLTITLDGAKQVVVDYASSPNATALQWLSPEQTTGKVHPYLFSQGEAILNRSWIPTQDSPGIRQTWDARITVPAGLHAVMSGEGNVQGDAISTGEIVGKDLRRFSFHMDHPVAPYLIAIAVGDIAFKSTGPRTGIFTEPANLVKDADEFSQLEQFVNAAESLYGPYRWGRYDVLVLPPSFPFGGMENPNLTFATPTIVAGDKSLVSVIAHELAHSWSGNLVTNATWNDFWLNEGFTNYFEGRIMEKVYGKARADMEADLGWSGLQSAIKAAGATSPDSQLHLALTAARDPDDGMNDIAYEKGATFLRTIEAAVGRERWDAYLRSYFDRHAFQPQTSDGFVADLRANLIQGDKALEDKIQIDRWVYQPGLPDNAVHIQSAAFPAVDRLAAAFAAGAPASTIPADWTTQERVRFLNQLPRALSASRLKALDGAMRLSGSGNSEVRFAWLRLALVNRYPGAAPSAREFLTSQGRRKFVLPLFSTMMGQGEWGKALAKSIYAVARPGYHPLTQGSVDKVVGKPGA